MMIVPNSILVRTAEEIALKGKVKPKKRKTSLMDKALEENPMGRKVLFDQATKSVLSKTKGNYPAPLKIIDCVRVGVERSPAMGYQVEADHFGHLVMTPESEQLRNLFFATTDMKKEHGVEGVEPAKVLKAGVTWWWLDGRWYLVRHGDQSGVCLCVLKISRIKVSTRRLNTATIF